MKLLNKYVFKKYTSEEYRLMLKKKNSETNKKQDNMEETKKQLDNLDAWVRRLKSRIESYKETQTTYNSLQLDLQRQIENARKISSQYSKFNDF